MEFIKRKGMKMSQRQNKRWFSKDDSSRQIIETRQLIFRIIGNTRVLIAMAKSLNKELSINAE